MDINRGTMNALFQGFSKRFMDGFGMAPEQWQRFSQIERSGAALNIYPFLEQFAGMGEWLDERQIKNVKSQKLSVANRKFEDTVAIPRDDLEDDQYGVYGGIVQQMGLNAGKVWHDLVMELITVNAATAKWADGQVFFKVDRTYGANVINNKGTAVLSAVAYKAARKAMREFKGHNGKCLGVNPNLLVCGPSNEEAAFDILKNELVIAGNANKKNVWYGSSDMLILPELSGDYANYWFLTDCSAVLKPVIVQQRKDPVLIRMDNDNDENAFMRDQYVYGTTARGAAAWSMPHLVYGGLAAA